MSATALFHSFNSLQIKLGFWWIDWCFSNIFVVLYIYIYINLIVIEATGKWFLITSDSFFFSYNCRAIVEFQLVFMHPCTRFYYHVKMAMQNLAGRMQINLKLIWAFKSLCKLRWTVFGFYLKVWWSPELDYAVYIYPWLVLHGHACSWCVCVLHWLLFADWNSTLYSWYSFQAHLFSQQNDVSWCYRNSSRLVLILWRRYLLAKRFVRRR